MKLMDVTLRESVYYGSGIDYKEAIDYLKRIDSFITPDEVEYIEICYINTNIEGHLNYNGDYIKEAYNICGQKYKLVGMMHPGNVDLNKLDSEAIKLFSMIRIVCGESFIPDSVAEYIKYFHALGVEVAVNISFALRKTMEQNEVLCKRCLEMGADCVYFADSSGSAYNDEIDQLCSILKKYKRDNVKVGFHLHDHLSLSFSNALRIYENGIDFTDVSITGAGRGGGNLKTELIVPFLKNKSGEGVSKDLLYRLLSYIEYFNVLVRRDGSIYSKLFLDTLSGIYRLGLKQQEKLEREASGNGYKYINLVLEEAERK